VFCSLLFWLAVPVQSIAWKDSSLNCLLCGTLNCTLTQSLFSAYEQLLHLSFIPIIHYSVNFLLEEYSILCIFCWCRTVSSLLVCYCTLCCEHMSLVVESKKCWVLPYVTVSVNHHPSAAGCMIRCVQRFCVCRQTVCAFCDIEKLFVAEVFLDTLNIIK